MLSQTIEKFKLLPLVEPSTFVRRLNAKVRNDWDKDNWAQKRFIFNHHYRFLYCPIHKNASTSRLAAMLSLSDSPRQEEMLKQSDLTIRLYVELNYSLASTSYAEAKRLLSSDYTKFVIVRNPWARIVSTYCYFCVRILQQGRISGFAEMLAKFLYGSSTPERAQSVTFAQFVEYVCGTDDKTINPHCLPQYLFLGGMKFDYIARLECLEADLKPMCDRLNLPLELPDLNRTQYIAMPTQDGNYATTSALELKSFGKSLPAYQQFYTPELMEKVANRYAKSIELFGYEFT